MKLDVGKLCCEMSHWYGFKIDYIMEEMTLNQVIIYYGNIPMEGIIPKGNRMKSIDKPDYKKIKQFMSGAKIKSK